MCHVQHNMPLWEAPIEVVLFTCWWLKPSSMQRWGVNGCTLNNEYRWKHPDRMWKSLSPFCWCGKVFPRAHANAINNDLILSTWIYRLVCLDRTLAITCCGRFHDRLPEPYQTSAVQCPSYSRRTSIEQKHLLIYRHDIINTCDIQRTRKITRLSKDMPCNQ